MVRPDDIVNFADQKWFAGLAGFGDWMATILGSILALATIYALYVMMEHKIKVTWFPVYGTSQKILEQVSTEEELRALEVTLGQPKTSRGREVKEKGVRKFSMMTFPNFIKPRKLKEIPFNLQYPDGIWMIRLTKDKFIPIERPILDNSVHINLPEADMDLWQESAEAELRLMTRDDDAMRKHLYMTAAIIIGAFVLAGIIIWLSMSFAGNSINTALSKMDGFTQSLQGFIEAKGPG